jgi:hypothetical protein
MYNRKIAPTVPVVHAMNGPFNNATVKIIKSFLSFLRSVGFRRTLTVYNSIHKTVRYASSLACSFNQIIWGIIIGGFYMIRGQ